MSGGAPVAPAGVDIEKPSAARVYDWYLGGNHHWAVDREFGRRVEKLWPLIRPISRQNRAFMNRVVSAAMDAGVRQFVDLGSGVPTAGNVHEIVRDRLPSGERASVVYVDYEPVAAAHSRLILEREGATDWAGLVERVGGGVAAVVRRLAVAPAGDDIVAGLAAGDPADADRHGDASLRVVRRRAPPSPLTCVFLDRCGRTHHRKQTHPSES
jgi:hypothetical protein